MSVFRQIQVSGLFYGIPLLAVLHRDTRSRPGWHGLCDYCRSLTVTSDSSASFAPYRLLLYRLFDAAHFRTPLLSTRNPTQNKRSRRGPQTKRNLNPRLEAETWRQRRGQWPDGFKHCSPGAEISSLLCFKNALYNSICSYVTLYIIYAHYIYIYICMHIYK